MATASMPDARCARWFSARHRAWPTYPTAKARSGGVWAAVGVLCGELTNAVLCLNLPGDAATVSGRAFAVWTESGQPVYLTARQVLRDPPHVEALTGRTVFACEDPTIVAGAANVLGVASAPLVCTAGHPVGAATLLLRLLVAVGAYVRYHGDFDWPGVTIANGIISRFGVQPWRLDAPAYCAAVRSGAGGAALRGRSVQATWDPDLTAAMLSVGRKVEEEQVLADLLADLAR